MGTVEFRIGFLTGVACIIIASIALYLHWDEGGLGDIVDCLGILTLGIGAYIAVKEKKEEEGKIFTFGKTFFTAMVTCFVAAMLIGSFYFVFAKYIEPNQAEAVIVKAKATPAAQKMSAEDIKRAEEYTREYYSPIAEFQRFAGVTMLYGLFVSLVVGVFLSRQKQEIQLK